MINLSDTGLLHFIEKSSTAVAIFDRNMNYLAVSEAFYKEYNLSNNIIGKNHYDVFPEIPNHWREIHQRCLSGAIEHSDEELFHRADGSVMWVKWQIRPWFEVKNEIGGIVLFSENITEKKNTEIALKRSEELFRATFDQASVGITQVRLDQIIVQVNDKFCDIIGYSKEDLIGKTSINITHPEDIETTNKNVQYLISNEKSTVAFEKRFIHKTGNIIWTYCTISLLRDQKGNPELIIGIIEDITDKKLSLIEKEKNEKLYHATIEQACIGMGQIALDGRCLFVNDAACGIFGYSKEEIIGHTFSEFTHPEDKEIHIEYINNMLSGITNNAFYEKRYIHKNGKIIWVRNILSLIRDSSGNPELFIGIAEDITDKKKIEKDLRDNEELFRAMFDQAGLATALIDLNGNWIILNKKAEDLTKYTRSELMEHPMSFLIHPDDHAITQSYIDKLLSKEEKSITFEKRYIRKDKKIIWVRCTMASLYDINGNIEKFAGIAEDITARREIEKALQESENLFHATFKQAAVGMTHLTLDGHWMLVNDKFCEIVGYSREELKDKRFIDITHPTDIKIDVEGAELLKSRKISVHSMEKRYIKKDGSIIWVNITASTLNDIDGNPLRFIAIIEDINERKKIEAALLESEERFKKIFKQAPFPNLLIDTNTGNIIDCNNATSTMLGYDYEILLKLNISDIDVNVPTRGLMTKKPTEKGDSFRFETQLKTISGDIRDVDIASVPIDINNKRLARITVVDITEKKINESRFRATFEQAAVGIAHISPTGKFLRVNKMICDRFKMNREEILKKSVQDMIHPDQRSDVIAQLKRVESGEIEAYSADRKYVAADGEIIDAACTISMVCNTNESPYFLVVAQDISSRKKAEQDLLKLNEELEVRIQQEVAAREVAQMKIAQAERLQALGQLAGGVAHDFNNILQIIQGGASMISLRASETAINQQYARIIMDAVDRGAAITNRLLTFARRGNLQAEPIKTAALLENIRDLLSPTFGSAYNIWVNADINLPYIMADKGQLETALVNLATNARDAMPNGGILVISATLDKVEPNEIHKAYLNPGNYIKITVSDTGTGMDSTILSHIFQPFFTTKPIGKGTGLGLSMVKGFVDQSNGGIVVDSTLGQGTTIILWLPAISIEDISNKTDDSKRNLITNDIKSRILIVDDDPLIIEILKSYIKTAGYNVVAVENGKKALDLLNDGIYSLLITDLTMPGIDGISLIIEAQKNRPTLPAILLTGYANDSVSTTLSGKIKGPFMLLQKPIRGTDLLKHISILLEDKKDLLISYPNID